MDLLIDVGVAAPHRADCRVVTVLGVLDLETMPHLECDVHAALLAGQPRIVLDLHRLRLCDAAAMSRLIRLHRQCAAAGGWVRLAAPQGMVRVTFAVVSFGRDVPVYADLSAAALGDEAHRIKD